MEAFRAQLNAQRLALEPAPGSGPSSSPVSAHGGGGNALFVVWHNRDGQLCTETTDQGCEQRRRRRAQTARVRRRRRPRPARVALRGVVPLLGRLRRHNRRRAWVLAGTVAADADTIEVTTADGQTAAYPLTGPLLAGGDRRVFMLELGKTDWRRLVLIRGGEVVDEAPCRRSRPRTRTAWRRSAPSRRLRRRRRSDRADRASLDAGDARLERLLQPLLDAARRAARVLRHTPSPDESAGQG